MPDLTAAAMLAASGYMLHPGIPEAACNQTGSGAGYSWHKQGQLQQDHCQPDKPYLNTGRQNI
jgi:hypothetical protein